MTAVWMRLRADMRVGWRAWVALALIFGISAGVAIAAAAGARRTQTAYPRFLRAQDSFHAMSGGGGEENLEARFASLPRLPEVRDSVQVVIVGGEVTIPARRGRPSRIAKFPDVFVAAEPSGRMLYSTHRAKVIEGRLADKRRVDETMIPFTLAERLGIRVGDTVTFGVGFDERFRPAERIPVRVVGIVAAPGDFEAVGQTLFLSAYATPALFERYREVLPPPNPDTWFYAFHLKGGAAAASAFKHKVERELDFDVPVIEPVVTAGVQKTMRLYSAALWLVAALIALATIAIFGQTLARQIALDSVEYPTLRALGFAKGYLWILAVLRGVFTALAALPLAVLVAYALSPLTPIGAARIAEPDPGFAFDATTIGVGVAASLVVAVLLAVYPAWRAARLASGGIGSPRDVVPTTTSRLVAGASRVSTSPAAVTGLRMALEPGRGRTAVPVRTTILAVAIGVAAMTGTVVVGRSLTHLIETPALAGFTYDAIVPLEGDNASPSKQRAQLASFPFVDTMTEGTGLNITMGGVDSFLVGFQHGDPIGFAVIDGRAPTDTLTAAGVPEIALGPATMRRIGAALGDEVVFSYPTHDPDGETETRMEQRARIVGSAAIPPLPWAATEAGEGGVMTISAINTFHRDESSCCFVRFRHGTDLAAARAALEREGLETFIRTTRADLSTLERITALPLILSAVFGAVGIAALAHVLVTGIRRRRRDLAILKTIGFVDRQLRGTVAWQASAITAVCLLVGIPSGIVLGRWGWTSVAAIFGVVPVSVTPMAVFVIAVPVALVLANVIALLPARAAARTQPATVLRSE